MVRPRKAVMGDLPRIMEIYSSARSFMKESGNPDQWKDVYPDKNTVLNDIELGRCYVFTEDGAIRGVAAVCTGEDPTYGYIEDGNWPDDGPYVAVHRVASDGGSHGIFRAAADLARTFCDEVRVDTHRDNLPMQRQITRYGFVRCGTIITHDGTPRIAYQFNGRERSADE